LLELHKLEGQSAYMMAFMDELQNYLKNCPPDINAFLQEWDNTICEKNMPSSEINGVRIVTIHKAKGLEYHTVLVPELDFAIEQDSSIDANLWCEAEPPFDTLGALPIHPYHKEIRCSCYTPQYKKEHLLRRTDNLNLLYVAFTRAQCNLMMWGSYTEKMEIVGTNQWEGVFDTNAIVGDLLRAFALTKSETDIQEGELSWQTGEPVRHAGRETQAATANNEPDNRLNPTYADCRQQFRSYEPRQTFQSSNASRKFLSNALNEGEPSSDAPWELGIIVHHILSQIRDHTDIEAALQTCQQEGLIKDERMAQTVAKRLKAQFEDRRVARWFATEVECFNECSVIGHSPDSGEAVVRRPDRVVVDGDTVWVIDYKLGRHDEQHDEQVQHYMEMLHTMYPDKKMRGALWYILKGEVREVS
ncbi:MAG: PD-(D/E)XK nuclease family protein, partial [Bacteroidaceae bacterium]|nr:PD-(D/E)XK nuclease family protein [Bacteroidaceae bacterium]